METTLRAAIERARAIEPAPGRTYECEVRVGVCVNAAGRRCADNARTFNANVSPQFFFATFQRLYDRTDTSVTAIERSSVSKYDATDARCEHRDGSAAAATTERWVDKRAVRRAIDHAMPEWWFDVRVAESLERELETTPERVRMARAKAQLVSSRARQSHPLTVEATPKQVRVRQRRSVVLSAAPTWRIDFTIVAVHVRSIHYDNGFAETALMATRRLDTHEIELELIDSAHDRWSVDALVAHCRYALEQLAWALGSSRAAITDTLREQTMRSEMGYAI